MISPSANRVLLIEPDRPLADHIAAFLSRADFTVETHSDPQAAIMIADANSPDIVIMDLLMASHSAIEFLYEFRSYPEWQGVPVIVLSSLSEDELRPFSQSLCQLNIHKHIYKPHIQFNALVREVQSLLQPAMV
ncbi:MAG TPA: response regulator [Candidatus Saccharimonadales bacterium]|nr:response regulator [Candidatus Saccharimonadales bacterium]